jgi:predicted ester cyclase
MGSFLMCEANRHLIRRLFQEIINEGNLAVIDDIYASNVVDRNAVRGQRVGFTGIRHTIAELRAALPDLHVTVEELKVNADTVVTHERWQGTHRVTGRQATGTVTHIFRIHDNKIVEEWSGGWEWVEPLGSGST